MESALSDIAVQVIQNINNSDRYTTIVSDLTSNVNEEPQRLPRQESQRSELFVSSMFRFQRQNATNDMNASDDEVPELVPIDDDADILDHLSLRSSTQTNQTYRTPPPYSEEDPHPNNSPPKY